jgi:hypothetical protein
MCYASIRQARQSCYTASARRCACPAPLAFVLIDIGDLTASAESLPVFYEGLSPGGMVVAFEYGQNTEHFAPIVERLGITPFWLPSGQAVIVKQ